MDERLDYYSSEEMLRKASSQWMIGHAGSSGSLEKESSRLFLQYKNYHLHLVQKKETSSERVNIPASKFERISYYRQYVTSIVKTQIVSMQTANFNTMLWTYLLNIVFKSLPHTYVHMFLASYVPENHMFVPKMVPFFYGFKFASLFTSLFEMLTALDNAVLLVSYLVDGLLYKSPWNRCIGDFNFDNKTVHCYDIENFGVKIRNESWTFLKYFFTTDEGQNFQLVQVEFFRTFTRRVPLAGRCGYLILIWTVITISHKLVFKKRFWKLLNVLQFITIGLEVMAYLYLNIVYYEDEDIPVIPTLDNYYSVMLTLADIDLLALSTTAPPVIHVLEARSTQGIKPSQDSAAIIMSNALLYIFKGLLMTRLRHHCQNMVKGPIKLSEFNPFSWFYLWPMFFTDFYLGDIYFLGFLILTLLIEVLALIVTYYCFVESIICEWLWIKPWMVTVAISVFFVSAYFGLKFYTHQVLLIYSKGIVTFVEILAIYTFYPTGRLVDDIMFHTGQLPTKLRILILRLMPVYYCVKLYYLMNSFITAIRSVDRVGTYGHYIWSWAFPLVPYVLGVIYASYKYIIKDRTGWQRMFVPVSDWGPRDQSTRQLRKVYDSRQYIGSQAIRSLSRYMLKKSESEAFQLDINYEPNRRSTMPISMYRMESEKKEK